MNTNTNTQFYAVAHHGTAGLGNSFGYAYVVEGEAPRHDQTTTVWGPYTQEQAQMEADRMDALCAAFLERED